MKGLLLLLAGAPVIALSARPAAVSVEDILAYPFCAEEGRVGNQDLLAPQSPVLWNSIIGAGDIVCSSRSTLIVVALSGPRGEYLGGTRLHVAVAGQPGPDSVVQSTHRLGVSSWEGKYHVPIWLENTGCLPVIIRAWVEGQEAEAREETIGFRCGE